MKKKRKLPDTEEQFQRYLRSFIVASLRRATLYWPYRNEALKAARVDRGLYKCNICKDIFHKKEIRLDHIQPVVKLSGFSNWDDYISRMYPKAEGFQTLCLKCNDKKTQEENILRKLKKSVDKSNKKS